MKIIGTRLVLIDASSLLYRSFYGLKPLTTSRGQKVQAIYGFFKSLRQIFDSYQPSNVALVWDKGDSGRKNIFPDYKKNRQAPPSDLLEQRHVIQQICDEIKIPQVGVAGYEADDVIFSLAQKYQNTVDTVFVVSPDKDLRQMVSSRCVVVDPIYRKVYTEEEFFKKYEFQPSQLSSYFGMVGDTADDIPGVAGVGDTTATALIKQFGTLDEIYNRLDEVTSASVKKKLEAGRTSAFLGKELFTLQYVNNFCCPLESLHYNVDLWVNSYPFFYDLEFKSLLPAGYKPPQPDVAHVDNWSVRVLETMDDLTVAFNRLKNAMVVTFDTETTGLDGMTAQMIGFSLACDALEGFYVSFIHDHWTPEQIEEIKIRLGELLTHHACLVMHNAKFDLHILATAGIAVPRHVHDTMLMADLLKTDEEQKVGLKSLSVRVLSEQMQDFKDVTAGYKSFREVPLDRAARYATHDVVQTYKLYEKFVRDLAHVPTLQRVYEQVELPLMHILFHMERTGIKLDAAKLKQVRFDVVHAMTTIDEKMRGFLCSIGYEGALSFNPQSPKQVGEILYDRLKLVSYQKTSTGQKSTNREVLEGLAKVHPFPGLILEYRELAKLLNTYLDPLPELINASTGRIHTSYSQVIAATGRLASSDPNLQNIPVAGTFGSQIRTAFVAPEGHVLVSADYSQIELRVLAHLTKDPVLTAAFKNHEDPHRQIAARLFGKPEVEITHAERQIGKKINFSIIYGLTPYGLSQDLGISLKDAKTYVEHYFAHYPAVRPWMEGVEVAAKEFGYVETMLGRRRYVKGLSESNKIVYEAARRVAVNTVVQGTAADIIKMAMIKVDVLLRQSGTRTKMLLQIHDELLFECPEDEAEKVTKQIVAAMQQALPLDVELAVSVSVGKNWGEV